MTCCRVLPLKDLYDHMKHRLLFIAFLSIIGLLLPTSLIRAQVNVTTETVAPNVTLLWEAQTYVPPFYKGKTLLADGGDVKIFAFPPDHLGDPSALRYMWKIDGEVRGDDSGIGRSFFIHRSGLFGGAPLIIVEVYRGDEKVGTGALRVPLVAPRIAVYPVLPLAGILFANQARTL